MTIMIVIIIIIKCIAPFCKGTFFSFIGRVNFKERFENFSITKSLFSSIYVSSKTDIIKDRFIAKRIKRKDS